MLLGMYGTQAPALQPRLNRLRTHWAKEVVEGVLGEQRAPCSGAVPWLLPPHPSTTEDLIEILACAAMQAGFMFYM
jgi:hypothetical protein